MWAGAAPSRLERAARLAARLPRRSATGGSPRAAGPKGEAPDAASYLARLPGWKGRLYDTDWFLRVCEACLPLGFIAVIAGWITTEVGRQPWVVYGLFRTADAVTPSLTGANVLASLIVYIGVYLVVYPITLYYLVILVRAGPVGAEEIERPIEGLQRPLPARAAAGIGAGLEPRAP